MMVNREIEKKKEKEYFTILMRINLKENEK